MYPFHLLNICVACSRFSISILLLALHFCRFRGMLQSPLSQPPVSHDEARFGSLVYQNVLFSTTTPTDNVL